MSAEPPPPTDAPAPSSDDFDPQQHLWDGTNWWSLDKQRWWDGSQWRSVAAPVVASAAPSPPPQVSPDGKFYWDGQRWVPMQAALAPEPPQPRQLSPDGKYYWDGERWVPVALMDEEGIARPPKKGHALRNVSLGCLGLIVLLFVIGLAANGANNTTSTSNSTTTSEPTSASAAPSASKFVTFGSGTKVVSKDIQAGTYRTRHDSSGCYFARLKGFGGALADIIANGNTDARVVVTILPTDAGFQSSNCDTWSSDLSAITTSNASFGDGDFIVGTDMMPGTYRNAGSSGCYWARLSGFGHTLGDIIANDNTDAQAVVTIDASDKGFESSNCGTWNKV